ncbi:MAG: carbonic anhydrase [Pirellulaceae bacterium]|nr:carbonic anhydrase [Pirellulaceae bacterium]
MQLNEAIENNRAWAAKRVEEDPMFFKRLARGQKPSVLYIGCSDSRVTAEEMLGAGPGDLFVHRNIANLIPNNDHSSNTVINFAIHDLGVKSIVVCGHYGCGGVLAAMQSNDLGKLTSWLQNIRDVYRLHSIELDSIENEEIRYRRLVELNVHEQCINLLKVAEVQNAYSSANLIIAGWVFDMATGRITDLKLDIEQIVGSMRDIYSIAEKV